MIKIFQSIFLLIVTFTICGCTGTDTLSRVTYESLQNMRQQECQKTNAPDCFQRKSYDKYQQERQGEK